MIKFAIEIVILLLIFGIVRIIWYKIYEYNLFKIVGKYRHCKKCGSIHIQEFDKEFQMSFWKKHSVWNEKCICNKFAEDE